MATQLLHSPRAASTTVVVRPAVSRAERNEFVRLPWPIYRNDPAWAPPLLLERKEFIDPKKHPFYLHGCARPMIAWRGGRAVGRILVSDDPLYNARHEDNVGCFGMFESIDDPAVSDALLESAADWLLARGRTRILGPIDYSTNYACGLLVDGFDTPPRVMMNHNPPYYARLLEQWGLTKAKDLYAWWFTDNSCIEEWRPRVERLAARSGVTVRPVRRADLAADVMRCREIYNAAWAENWGNVPMTLEEFNHLAKFLLHLAIPELILIAEIGDRPVGFSMTLPDFNEAARPLNGRLFPYGLPIGLIRFLRRLKRVKTGRLLALGLAPEFRRQGVAELLILRTFDYGKNEVGFTGAELSWTLEDNYLINRTIQAVGGQRYKTYRIYERTL